ncbi:zinc finger translocation-associated protein [Brachionichthys hirsutus]|uniref:zinc finger translocation-associated protein n=1 Tax=Brachionichthys hirsutus TaxID=412623 RepID=UPI0036053991
MDYDPLNQLLVCMACGELQYSHSLEGVRAHIDEAHPDTLSLHAGDKRTILETWDEQVSQRERFFTSQLRQHGGAPTDTNGGAVD